MKDNFCRFGIMSFNTLNPFGTVGSTSGYHYLFGILILGASNHLGGTYGGNMCLASESLSSSHGGVFCGVVAFTFLFLFPVHFPHVVLDGPGWLACNFPKGLTGICSTS